MAARATRSASGAASSCDDTSRCFLLALSHDELGVVFDGLADPLQPVVAVALSSTCLGLRTPLWAALEVLKERHERVVAFCARLEGTCAEMRGEKELYLVGEKLTTTEMATLGMILRSNSLPTLRALNLSCNYFGDAGLQALCEGLGLGSCPSLIALSLESNHLGTAGAEALAAAIRRGAMPNLESLVLADNPDFGNQTVAELAPALRKLPLLLTLSLWECGIGDAGVASLVDNLGKDDFKALETLDLDFNKVTDKGCATLAKALKAGALPSLTQLEFTDFGHHPPERNNPASDAAKDAVQQALMARPGYLPPTLP